MNRNMVGGERRDVKYLFFLDYFEISNFFIFRFFMAIFLLVMYFKWELEFFFEFFFLCKIGKKYLNSYFVSCGYFFCFGICTGRWGEGGSVDFSNFWSIELVINFIGEF